MKKSLLFALSVFILLGCGHNDNSVIGPSSQKSESLIGIYYKVSSSNPIRLQYNIYQKIGATCDLLINFPPEGPERYDLNTMRKLYDDTHFNSYFGIPGGYSVYGNDFTAVDLISDTDFNGIKAGESLGGVVKLLALSPYRWLTSGSKVTFDWNQYNDDLFLSCIEKTIAQLFPVNGFLKDLTAEDLKLLGTRPLQLYFTELPSIKEHTLTITFYEGESSYAASTKVVFE